MYLYICPISGHHWQRLFRTKRESSIIDRYLFFNTQSTAVISGRMMKCIKTSLMFHSPPNREPPLSKVLATYTLRSYMRMTLSLQWTSRRRPLGCISMWLIWTSCSHTHHSHKQDRDVFFFCSATTIITLIILLLYYFVCTAKEIKNTP